MEKICRTLCLSKNGSKDFKICKSDHEVLFNYLFETPEVRLGNWKLPPFEASDVYKRSRLFNSSPIKTVEKEIPLSEGYAAFALFSEDLKKAYNKFTWIHVGMIQVGLKTPKLGSHASAIICLRYTRRKTFAESVVAMAESSLSDGHIYFSHFPLDFAYVDLHQELSTSFGIDVKTQSDDNVTLVYRLHYRLLHKKSGSRTRDLRCYRFDESGTTTMFLTDTKAIWSRKTSWWDEVAIPERWAEWTETAEAHLLKVDVPVWFQKEEIEVTVEGGRILRISGESSFLRRLRLPENGKAEEVTAVMENGVLVVMVPKEELNEELKLKIVGIVGC